VFRLLEVLRDRSSSAVENVAPWTLYSVKANAGVIGTWSLCTITFAVVKPVDLTLIGSVFAKTGRQSRGKLLNCECLKFLLLNNTQSGGWLHRIRLELIRVKLALPELSDSSLTLI
jgi:hypothetical protein